MGEALSEVKSGDEVLRWIVGCSTPMPLIVKIVTTNRIICVGGWEFDRATGMEIDEQLDWGPDGVTGSWIKAQDELSEGFDE